MEYITFSDDTKSIQYAIFIKNTSSNRKALLSSYIHPLEKLGIYKNQIVVVSITPPGKTFTAKETKLKLEKIAKGISNLNIKNILVANGDLYKYIVGVTKTSNCFGEVRKGTLPGYEDINLVLSIDYNALLYNESLRFKLHNSIEVFYKICTNAFQLNKDIIHTKDVPTTATQIKDVLNYLSRESYLTCDVETESLRFEKARIITISFGIDKHNGAVFSIDTHEEKEIKKLLYEFFRDYRGTLIFWNALYDCKVIIYQLFMKDSLDLDGLREGLLVFKDVEDAMLVTYLATNSTQETPLDLKSNCFEYAGNYGIDVTYANTIPREELLEYNLKDSLCTWYVLEKNYPIIIKDDQVDIYRNKLIPSILPNLYMMLIGMPMNMPNVIKLDEDLDIILNDIQQELQLIPEVVETIAILKEARRVKDNLDRVIKAKNPDKIKRKTLDDIKDEPFNPNSDKQKQALLYDVLGLKVINRTDGGAPACDDKTLKALSNRIKNTKVKKIISLLQDYAAAFIVSSTFVKAFIEFAFTREDGSVWLNGNKRLGGTQSGRGSSNQPNMENIPNHSTYGERIKECFEAMDNWLFGGADFMSLEDRINAILTQDPNKLKVYTDGYDGHCLRAYSYFGDQMPDIINTVDSINSIEHSYADLRQSSKQPTFALTYLGTAHTLVKNLGLTKKEAKSIEDNYHKLYTVSDAWSEDQISFATNHGYVECAFGLRLRTPLLAQTLRTKTNKIHMAEKEGRSAVNAVTQSWGLLINRTATAIILKILNSKYYNKIFPVNTIHDAIYFIFVDDPEVIQWLNTNLIKEMEWNDHPAIKSADVPMGAKLGIGKNWKEQYTVPNNASINEINKIRKRIYDN